jgi:uncharacterized protein YdhG (YjbR/CyaY superfamily)
MAKTSFKSVDQYIASQSEALQTILACVRDAIRTALPKAQEVISYQIPAYKLPSGTVVYFAGWKQHYSIYPATARVVAKFRGELSPYKLSKGTIRFPLAQPVPVKLIARIAKFRAKEVAERGQAAATKAP